MVGRSKDGAFKNLTDRSRGKVGGWKGQGMSKKRKRDPCEISFTSGAHVCYGMFPTVEGAI